MFAFALLTNEWHRQAYEVKHVRNGSVKPLVHAMVGLCTLGYILNFGHLSSKLTTLEFCIYFFSLILCRAFLPPGDERNRKYH